jgi:hypothetical protein
MQVVQIYGLLGVRCIEALDVRTLDVSSLVLG